LQGIYASKININSKDYSRRAGNDLNREIMTKDSYPSEENFFLTAECESYNKSAFTK
jgi:hypothetical protein